MKRLKIAILSALLTVTAGAFAGWSGSGSFTRSHDWTDDAAAAVPITASRMDAEDDNFATGINACLAKNGENAATGNLNIGGYRLTSVGAGSASTDAATIGGTETLTNKTITAPVLSGTVTGTYTLGGTPTLNLASVTTAGDLPVASGGTGSSTAAAARTALDAMEDVFTTRGDFVRGGASGVAERIALGTTGYILRSDGTDIAYATPYQAATVYISTDQAHSSSGSWVDVAFNTESFDPLTAHSAGTFTVPAWANKARFTANIAFEGSGAGPTGRRAARVVTGAGAVLTPNIYKIVDPSADVSGDTMVPLISGIFPVTASGTYKIQAFQNSGGTIQINGTNSVTWATVEFFP